MTSRRRPDAALCGPNHARKKILKNGDCPGFLRCVILHHQKKQYAHSSETDIVSIHTGLPAAKSDKGWLGSAL